MKYKVLFTILFSFLLNNVNSQSVDSTMFSFGITFNNISSDFSKIDKIFGRDNIEINQLFTQGFMFSIIDRKKKVKATAELFFIDNYSSRSKLPYSTEFVGYGYTINLSRYFVVNRIFSVSPIIGLSNQKISFKIYRTVNVNKDFNSTILNLNDERQIDSYYNVLFNSGVVIGADFTFLKCPMNFEIQPGYIIQFSNPKWESNDIVLTNVPKVNIGGFNFRISLNIYLNK